MLLVKNCIGIGAVTLVILLASVFMCRAGFGRVLAVVRSFTLAAVLTVVGLFFIKGSVLVLRVSKFTGCQRYLLIASFLVIPILGVKLITEVAMSIRF